jgi:hypothetical protein
MLFGIYLAVQYFAALGDSFRFPTIDSSAPLGDQVWVRVVGFFAHALGAGIFTLGPGLILIAYSSAWADRLFPPSVDDTARIEFRALLAIGLTILGYYFVITGLGGVVSSVIIFASGPDMGFNYGGAQLGSALVSLVCGAALCIAGRRAV